MIGKLWKRVKRSLFVRGNVRVGANFHIGLGSFVSSPTSLTIGDNVYIGKHCTVECSGIIGDEVLIANNVGIVGRRDHDIKDIGVGIRSARSVSSDRALAVHPANSIEIEDDVWVGFGAIILSGIRIGRGAIVAAGSVVTTDVPRYAIVRGNPAQTCGIRFTEEERDHHEQQRGRRLAER